LGGRQCPPSGGCINIELNRGSSTVSLEPRPEALFSSLRAGPYTRRRPYVLLIHFAAIVISIDEERLPLRIHTWHHDIRIIQLSWRSRVNKAGLTKCLPPPTMPAWPPHRHNRLLLCPRSPRLLSVASRRSSPATATGETLMSRLWAVQQTLSEARSDQ